MAKIGDILVAKGVISQEILGQALEIQKNEPPGHRRQLGKIFYEDLGVDQHSVLHELSQIFAIKEVEIHPEDLTDEQVEFIDGVFDSRTDEVRASMIRAKMVPFHVRGQGREAVLTIIAADPTDPDVTSMAEQLPFGNFEIVYSKVNNVDAVLNKVLSSRNDFLGILDEIQYDEDNQVDEEDVDEAALDAEINQSALTALVEGVLVEAVRQDVSDVHIVPQPGNITDINFRVDGKLETWHSQKGVKPEAISAVFKDKTRNVDRFERDMAQDGFIQRKIDDYLIRYRVSIIPIVGSEFDRKLESIVIRILDDRKVITDLNLLGLQSKALSDFKKAINKPSGIVIVTGPTGSGKSTTLVAALHAVITPEKCVLTVEDPVEYLIRGSRQLKISDKMGFEAAIRAILRHDPDIVLVGEIRDLKTAETAIKLANTGHLTFSTLHTNDAPSAVSRLYKMGIEPFLIASSVSLIMAQRLIRRLCKVCKRPLPESEYHTALQFGFTEEDLKTHTIYEPVGCDKCRNGYKGRSAVMESLYFTPEIRKLIVASGEQVDEEAIREEAVKNGMLTLRMSGMERIKEGVTSIEEVLAVTVEDGG
ncbi:MAG: Flp pilus assembly complex ATPase component TadA [Candidatus Marinimicrobia bacterium]|nr:Flp pilus assembly complex ATPase component TadA [Candidatus Neomarinimicrobiota bacterium]